MLGLFASGRRRESEPAEANQAFPTSRSLPAVADGPANFGGFLHRGLFIWWVGFQRDGENGDIRPSFLRNDADAPGCDSRRGFLSDFVPLTVVNVEGDVHIVLITAQPEPIFIALEELCFD